MASPLVRADPPLSGRQRPRDAGTRHLVRHDHLPIVVTRDDRGEYINALEADDDGNLIPLVALTARSHRRSVMQAVSR